jgi:hypothetical protein
LEEPGYVFLTEFDFQWGPGQLLLRRGCGQEENEYLSMITEEKTWETCPWKNIWDFCLAIF